MYDISFTKQEIEYLKTVIAKKIDTYSGHESKVLESIKRKLDNFETAGNYYDGPEY